MFFNIFLILFLFWIIKELFNKTKLEILNFKKNIFGPKDKFLKKIEKSFESISSEIKNTSKIHEKFMDENYKNDMQKKEQLSKFAKKHHLDEALIAIWLEIIKYPTWSKRDDFSKFNKLNIQNCTEIKNEKNEKIISFSWKNNQYEINYKEHQSYLPDEYNHCYADFILFEGKENVFGVSADICREESRRTYSAISITVFKKKGEWSNLLLDAWKTIKTEEEKTKTEWKYINADKIKDNFQN